MSSCSITPRRAARVRMVKHRTGKAAAAAFMVMALAGCAVLATGEARLAEVPEAVIEAAGCPSADEVSALVKRYNALEPLPEFNATSMAAARSGAVR